MLKARGKKESSIPLRFTWKWSSYKWFLLHEKCRISHIFVTENNLHVLFLVVNSINLFLHSHGLCYLNTPSNVFSLHTLVSRKHYKPTHLHVSIIHTFSSEMFGAKSINYFLLTHGLCYSPMACVYSPMACVTHPWPVFTHPWPVFSEYTYESFTHLGRAKKQDKPRTHLHVSRMHTISFQCIVYT